MKRILLYIAIAVTVLLTSCNSFLDTENYTEKDLTNFPESVEDANQMLAGIYSSMNVDITSGFYLSELASDDRLGGGSQGDKFAHAIDRLMNVGTDMCGGLWAARYRGIERCNLLFENIDRVTDWSDEAEKNQLVGEVYFLRAMFYFELAQVYGQVPLVLTTAADNLPKASTDEIYAQITTDLKEAIEKMNTEPYDPNKAGHATRWAAEALMARVYLFYTGYYKKEVLPLTDGGTVSKQEVIAWLDDCIRNSGHDLVQDTEKPENSFYNLWPYSNEYTDEDYAWAKEKGVKWVGDGNIETVFAIRYNNLGNWDYTGYTNMHATHFGLRTPNGNTSTFPFGEGYGIGPVNPQLITDWQAAEPNDLRLWGSVIDIENDLPAFEWGADLAMEETGYMQKKYLAITAYDHNTLDAYGNPTFLTSYSHLMYGTPLAPVELACTQDLVLIRFADVLLMHSELTETTDGINRVRSRAGLNEVGAYSLEALKRERRFELAFEGLRWNDLRRWGDAETAIEKQSEVMVRNLGNDAVQNASYGGGWAARYRATGGFFPIPDTQVTRSDGVLTQNEGWGTAAAEYMGW